MLKLFADQEVSPMARSLPEIQAFVEKEVKAWAEVIKSVGITID